MPTTEKSPDLEKGSRWYNEKKNNLFFQERAGFPSYNLFGKLVWGILVLAH